ncbi:transmembrane protein 272-like [Betta splendens]|uniref:Transmembrane protein 272-like n=1 Tax=Betta splendens TaxID=158456 RepID=A0A8M1HBK4_BETSP|nr:transmembrane protein 272-like [Betta splendens]
MSNIELLRGIRNTTKVTLPVLVCSKSIACILPVAYIVIGSLYLNECPRQHYIPIYLIASGGLTLLNVLLSCIPCTQRDEDDNDAGNTPLIILCTTWNSLTSLFLFCWFIAGNVWIYSIYQPNYTKNSTSPELYCNKTLYMFAFWTTTVGYILAGLSVVSCSCLVCCFRQYVQADPDNNV